MVHNGKLSEEIEISALVFSHPLIKRKGHFLPGINETPDLRSTDSSSSIGQGGNSVSGDPIHVTPGIKLLLSIVPVEPGHFGRSLHVKPGIKPVFLTSIKSSIEHGGKATFPMKKMHHYMLKFGFLY